MIRTEVTVLKVTLSQILSGASAQSNVGPLIRELRQALKMTQHDLADHLGIVSAYLSDMELGKRGMSIPTAKRFSAFLLSLDPPDSSGSNDSPENSSENPA